MYNLLNEKEPVCHDILSLFGLFNLGNTLSRLIIELFIHKVSTSNATLVCPHCGKSISICLEIKR